jgi:hypothetical protein
MDPDSWLPFYPDLIPLRRSRREGGVASQPPYNVEIFPVADVLASLTFLPSYPDQVPHLRVPREQLTVTTAAILVTTIHPLVWRPTYPDRVPSRRLPLGGLPSYTASPPGYLVTIAQRMAWQARFPDRVSPRRFHQPAGAAWAGPPLSVIGAGLPCVQLALDTGATTTFIDQGLTTTEALQGGLGSSSLINEDLC